MAHIINTLEYFFDDGRYEKFDKYNIDINGVISHVINKNALSPTINASGYRVVTVYDNNEKSYCIRISRAIASSFIGKPPTLKHTADHIDQDNNNDALDNIRWLCKRGQSNNRNIPTKNKSAFIIIKDGIEKTIQEWIDYLKSEKNSHGNNYTKSVLEHYAQRKVHGFAYKEYSDIDGEVWKIIKDSKNSQGHWEISNMNRVKHVKAYASNVLWDERIGLLNGYPKVCINGKTRYCHVVAFQTFFPDKWDAKKKDEIILHQDDDKTDFRPDKLCIGTRTENGGDAHDNGKYDGKKTARKKCISYINGEFEKEHESKRAAERYLRKNGFINATRRGIHQALVAYISGKHIVRYDRTWKIVSSS